jgi:hypothetical protein
MRLFRVLLAVMAVAAGIFAQTAEKPLTNSDLQAMLVAGLPEGTILVKIQTAALRGLVDLDASSAGLITLKLAGAGEQVLNAVMWAEPFGAGLKQQQQEDRSVPGLPSSVGVYYRAPSGYAPLQSFLLWPPLYSGGARYSRRSQEHDVPLEGSNANLQIAEAQPTFYLRSSGSNAWRIIRVASRDDRRSLRLVSGGGFWETTRFPASEGPAVQIIPVLGGVSTLRPVTPLEPGEYVLCTPVPGGADLDICYGFSVRR